MSVRGAVVCGLVVLLSGFLFAASPADATSQKPAAPGDPILGLWYTQDRDGGVEFYSCGPNICGRFYWLKDDDQNGDISRDMHNPDAEKRGQPLCGLTFMTGFVPDGKGKYTGGTIYSPRHGANFDAEMTLQDHDTLGLHGYISIPLLGSTQTWKRAGDGMPRCRASGQPNAAPGG